MIDPKRKYWLVSLIESVGEGPAGVNIECIIHDIPADTAPEAAQRGLLQYMKRNPGSEPKLNRVELEDYSLPLVI